MADILIRGMEMPKEGEKILISAGGSVWVNAWPTRGYMRMENVYAVPLPEKHGRLGDLDKINASLEAMIEIEHNQKAAPHASLEAMIKIEHNQKAAPHSWSHAYIEMQSILDDALTIAPAEGGGVEDYPTYLDCPKPKKPPQDRPLCDTCKHAIDGVVDDFATVFCTVRQGYFGQVTECKDYKDKRGGGGASQAWTTSPRRPASGLSSPPGREIKLCIGAF